MKRNRQSLALALALAVGTPAAAAAQAVSPYLFGQNFWLEQGSEGGRPGYLHLLWPQVTASGVRLVRIGGNAYEHDFPEEKRLVAMIAAVRAAGAEPLLQVPSRFERGRGRGARAPPQRVARDPRALLVDRERAAACASPTSSRRSTAT